METDTLVQLIFNALKELGAYVRVLCMDDDTITRSHMKEDLGPKSKECLPKELASIKILADPSHRKRTVSNWYWGLVGKPVGECALVGDQANILVTHFAYFQNQIKDMTFEQAKEYHDVPMRHIVRHHTKCGKWCLSKRAADESNHATNLRCLI